MKINCKIIQDLLPLYYDTVCSDESRQLVDEHLKECEKCSEQLKILADGEIEEKININIEKEKINSLKSLKKKLIKRNVRTSIISIIVVLIIVGIGYSAIFKLEQPIPYKEGLITVEAVDNKTNKFTFQGDDFYKCYALQRTVTIEGKEKNILMFYYTNTIWRRIMPKKQYMVGSSNYFDKEENYAGWSKDTWENIYTKEGIDEVYYYVGDYYSMYDEAEIDEALDKATLLWRK